MNRYPLASASMLETIDDANYLFDDLVNELEQQDITMIELIGNNLVLSKRGNGLGMGKELKGYAVTFTNNKHKNIFPETDHSKGEAIKMLEERLNRFPVSTSIGNGMILLRAYFTRLHKVRLRYAYAIQDKPHCQVDSWPTFWYPANESRPENS
jgi:hypothetical protein